MARWLVRGALLFLLAFANVHDIWSPDVVPNTLLDWSIVRQGNVDFDGLVVPPGTVASAVPAGDPGIPADSYFFRPCGRSAGAAWPNASTQGSPRSPGGPPPPGPGDRVCSIFPPGISLLALPIVAPFVLAGASPADGALVIRVGHLAAAIVETIAALLLWSVLRRFTSARWALGLVLLYWLGTSVRTVASQALWQHAGVHLAIALGLWLVLRDGAVSLARELLAGIALGFGMVVRQTTLIPLVGSERFAGGTAWRARVALIVGAAIGVIPLFVYNAVAFGSPAEQGYGPKLFTTPPLTGLYGLLLSPSRGIFVYEPWTIAALAALVLAWRRAGPAAERLRALGLAWLVLLVFYALYVEWWGGRVFGPRFLDDMAPVLVAALAWGIGRGLLARTWARVAFAVAAAWSLLLFNAAALVYDPNGWDTLPTNVNFDPSRLFSWSDPQWLSVLSSLAHPDARVLLAALLSVLLLALLLRLELRVDQRSAG
ncbi:MAG: hypothetical protein KGJ98_03925 [Chloroflexota bacterium]|nr:hypothetical protein [Chloroflexota bacterium]MDE3101363.1 hypothetical protein [Chloroflexota bacterium]